MLMPMGVGVIAVALLLALGYLIGDVANMNTPNYALLDAGRKLADGLQILVTLVFILAIIWLTGKAILIVWNTPIAP